ncbi:PD-(D/E)XK motif protein [Parenemella sanctibonifatiensis]|nr:PD-(D/E)XK motif protein [Parenemella sanctibonifatiensis]
MSTERGDLIGLWQELRANRSTMSERQLWSQPLPVNDNSFVAIDANNRVHLLLVRDAAVPDQRFGAVDLTSREWTDRGQTAMYLDLRLDEPGLEPAFAWVCEELLHRVTGGDGAASAVFTVMRDMELLLARPADMSASAVVGLIGELETLGSLIDIHGEHALTWWTGPLRQRHDFTGPGASLEVKTTASLDSGTFTMHGLWQAGSPDQSLYLAVYQIEQNEQGTSLTDRAAALLKRVADRRTAQVLLAKAGFRPEAERADVPHLVVSSRAWSVTDEFPFIQASDLPEHVADAITNLRYSLQIGSLPQDARQDLADVHHEVGK